MSLIKNYLHKQKDRRKRFFSKLKDKNNREFVFDLMQFSFLYVMITMFIFFFVFGPLNILTVYNYETSKNDNVSINVANFCNYKNTTKEKIYCVYYFVVENFKYKNTNNIIKPDELIKNGGDCKSWSNFYLTTLKNMNIKVRQDYESVENHTFVIADTKNGYCLLDQINIECFDRR